LAASGSWAAFAPGRRDNDYVDVGQASGRAVSGGGVFVGRERELAELLEGLDDALEGRGRLFLVAGEPGIGKSRLTDELASRARERGVRVLYGRCWEAGGAPTYWPWVQALRAHVREQPPDALRVQLGAGAGELAQILPEVREMLGDVAAEPLDAEGARFRLFDATAAFLREVSAAQPLVIVLDDLNAADTPSLLLLQFVAGELSETRILLACAYRDVDVAAGDPLASTVRELARHGVTRRLHIRGLSEPDVARFIEIASGITPPARVVAAVYHETEGNPLFVGEVVRLLADEGRLETVGSEPSWRLRIPQSVRDVIERRLGRLSDECNRVLELASVVGREFGLDALERFSGLDGDELLEALDEAIEARVVAKVPGALGRLRFSHALIRDTLYDALSTARRIRLHRSLGDVLEQLYAADPDPHLAELAHHFFEAAPGGDIDRAIDYARRAGDRAAALYGYEDAVRLYRMSLEALDFREAGDDTARSDLLVRLGEALARAGDEAAAKATFLAAAEIARRAGQPDQLARAALGYGGRYLWVRAGGDPHVVPLLEDALAALPEGDSPTRVRLMGRLACARRSDPDREPGAALSEQAVAMARRLGDAATLAYALDAHYGAHWWYDNPWQRLDLAAELAAVARESRDGERIAQAHLAQLAVLLELGRIPEAEAVLADLARVADEIRQPSQQWMPAATRGMLALFRGEFAEAEELMGEALRLGEAALTFDAEACFRANSYWLRREQGRLDELETAMRRTADEFSWYPMFRCFLAELYADLDHEADARRVCDELVANDFEALLPRDNEWLLGASVLADVCAYLGDGDRARKLYDELMPVAELNVVGLAELGRGSAARSLGVLSALLGRHDEAEQHFQAALVANERMGARPWVARTQHEYAQMLLARDAPGDRARARELLGAALETASEVGMATLAARIENAGGQVPSPPTPAQAVFRREGEYWSIVYEGDAFLLKDSKGLHYLARLLAAPGEELHALELVGADQADERKARFDDGLEVGGFGDAGEMLDPQAKAAYRQRLEELRDEIEEAESWNDPERAARARAELEFIARELSAAVGLGGRDRRAASAAERARVNVTRAIKSALSRIEAQSPALGAHLERTVRTGTFCSYAPDPRLPLSWLL
jgi:tetratricopeptide (TPR) repeat protein